MQHQSSLKSVSSRVDGFLCAVLRGEQPAWPAFDVERFEDSFRQRSFEHGVEALVFHQMQDSAAWSAWPRGIRDGLTDACRAGIAFEMYRRNRVEELLFRLAERHIDFLVIKGEALARNQYPDSTLRTRCDTDVFIRPQQIEDVRTVLLESGFEVIAPLYKTHQFCAVANRAGPARVNLDIHWRIQNAARYARSIGFDEALAQSVPLKGMEHSRTLGPVDSLLLACMHRSGNDRHDAERLIWLYDIHILLSGMTPEQSDEFAAKAIDRDLQACCLSGVESAVACFNTKVSGELLPKLSAGRNKLSWWERYRKSHLGLLAADFGELAGMHAKAGLLSELFFPPAGSLMNRYGKDRKIWLPVIYLKYIFSRVGNRLLLK